MAKAAKKQSKYSPHPGLRMDEAGKAKILAKTGRSFDDWVVIARKKGPPTQKQCSAWLREQHGIASMNAWWIASLATAAVDEPNYDEPEQLVDALYSGEKAALRPLHEKVIDAALEMGEDVIATSCKTMVPLYRKHVFAELRPVNEAVEVSMALGESAPSNFEVLSRNPGDRLTHRTLLRTANDVDAKFVSALRAAYEHGAKKMARAGTAKTPPDLEKALKASQPARATWTTCTPAMQRDWIVWIESAKHADTRARRVERAAGQLADGKKKLY